MRPKLAWGVLAIACIAFLWGIVELYDLRLGQGDIYPVYSSLRSDPLGVKVLFESAAELPGYTVTRNFYDIDHLHETGATILWLGEDPFYLALRPESDLKEFEDAAGIGNRLVIAMFPVKPRPGVLRVQPKDGALEKHWGVTFADVPNSEGPMKTSLAMMTGGRAETVIEKQFGKGTVVLVNSSYAFSNEALARGRDTELLARVLGPNRQIIFDEYHLGMSEEPSIVMLARKYRLTGLAAGLLLLAFLFIWRNSSSLLPVRRRAANDEVQLATGRDSASALQNLLRRNIPQSDLIPTCVAEWEKSRPRVYSSDKLNAVRQLATNPKQQPAVEVYRRLQSIITHKDSK